jgi:hypothetical protein
MSARAHGISGLAPQQLFFPFVRKEDREQLHKLYSEHFDKAERSAVKRAETNRRKLSLKVVDGRTLPFDSPRFRSLLDLPIGPHQASDLDVQPEPEIESSKLLVLTAADEVERTEWSDAAIEQLHEGLLYYSLNLLKSKGNAKEKHEILRWIWASAVFCWTQKTIAGVNKLIPILRRDLPFTFERCCAVIGCDATGVRDGLVYVLRKFTMNAGLDFKELGIDIDS